MKYDYYVRSKSVYSNLKKKIFFTNEKYVLFKGASIDDVRFEGAGRGNENNTVDHLREGGGGGNTRYHVCFFTEFLNLWFLRIHTSRDPSWKKMYN